MQPTRAWPSSIWPAQPAQPTSPPCPLPPLPGGRTEARRGTRPRGLGHLLLPLATSCFLSSPWTPSATPRTLPGLALSPCLLPPLLWLPLSSTERSPVATDAVRRGHNHRLASPTPPKAPPVLPLPPHQDGRRRKPWMGPASPFPSSATADRRRQIRPRPASLKLAVHLYRVYVSSPSVSPSLFRRSRAVARLSTKTETPSPPAMAPPWPGPPQPAPEHVTVLGEPPGARSTPRFLL